MACCGKLRQQLQVNPSTQTHRGSEITFQANRGLEAKRYSYAYFQYVGRGGLTVAGPISGSRYRFDTPGAIVAVDPRDRGSLAGVPNLIQVRGPI